MLGHHFQQALVPSWLVCCRSRSDPHDDLLCCDRGIGQRIIGHPYCSCPICFLGPFDRVSSYIHLVPRACVWIQSEECTFGKQCKYRRAINCWWHGLVKRLGVSRGASDPCLHVGLRCGHTPGVGIGAASAQVHNMSLRRRGLNALGYRGRPWPRSRHLAADDTQPLGSSSCLFDICSVFIIVSRKARRHLLARRPFT